MTFILLVLNIAMILTIWFKTNAFVEYALLLGLGKVFTPIKMFEDLLTADTFVNFIATHYNSFFIRLITCPICTSFWLSNFLVYFFSPFGFAYVLPVAFLSLISYGILGKIL